MTSSVYISKHPLVQHMMTLLRDQRTEPRRFRELLREVAAMIAYEALGDIETEEVDVLTPMGQAVGRRMKARVGLVPILRAGLGMVEGVWRLVPDAQVWHIGLLRDERTLEPVEYYSRFLGSPTVDICLILDPMLATGRSAMAAVELLKRWGVRRIKFVGVIASAEGVRRLTAAHPDVPLYLAALDDRLNEAGLIVPGLGNAGDRLFGTG